MKEERRDENLAAKIVRNFAYLDAVWSFLLAVADGASLSSGGPPVPFTARFAVFLDSFCGALAGVFLLYAVAEGVQIDVYKRQVHPPNRRGPLYKGRGGPPLEGRSLGVAAARRRPLSAVSCLLYTSGGRPLERSTCDA